MGEAVLPSLIEAFELSRRRHGAGTGSIADVACGTGRFLNYLTRFGGRLTGIDRAPAMLRLARQRLEGSGVALIEADLRNFALDTPVETLTCTFDTINYLRSAEDLARAFAAFARALLPGGTLVFDFIPEGAGERMKSGRQRLRFGRVLSEWRVRLDPGGRGSEVAILMRRTDRPELPVQVELHRQRWHPRDEVRALAEAAGFEVIETRPAEMEGGGGWLHVVARRSARSRG